MGIISNAVYFLQATLSQADEKTKEYLEIISTGVYRAEKIVSALFDLSHTRPPQPEKIAISTLATEVLGRQLPPETVRVTSTINKNLPPVFVDIQQIKQALANLALNAYQAMPDGGELTLGARIEPDRVCLLFTDTGQGIPPAILPKIFEPLFGTKVYGIGLGLTVAKNLIEVNEGSLAVESVKGQGSTFTVTLPTKVVVS